MFLCNIVFPLLNSSQIPISLSTQLHVLSLLLKNTKAKQKTIIPKQQSITESLLNSSNNNNKPNQITKTNKNSMGYVLCWVTTPGHAGYALGWYTQWHNIWENHLSFFQQVTITNNFLGGVELNVHFHFSVLSSHLVWTSKGLVYALTVSVSVYVYQACCI